MKNGTQMDDVDIKILKLLQDDAKLTAKNLGDRIALSQTPVYERIRKLEKKGVIRKYVALLNPEILNKSLVIFMNITVRDHSSKSRIALLEALNKLEEVVELYQTSGQFDYTAKVRVSNVTEYRNFLIDKLTPIENVKDIDSHIVMEEIKYTTSLNL